jgi:hypothetical protein
MHHLWVLSSFHRCVWAAGAALAFLSSSRAYEALDFARRTAAQARSKTWSRFRWQIAHFARSSDRD